MISLCSALSLIFSLHLNPCSNFFFASSAKQLLLFELKKKKKAVFINLSWYILIKKINLQVQKSMTLFVFVS